jgi:sulfonate transport system substrate-binding protein
VPITKALLAEQQQQIADTFFQLGLVPKQVNVLEASTAA